MIREIIVVEGRDDTAAVQRAVEADTIETGGSALSEEVIARIRLAQATRGVIILTDPDYPGERIRRILSARVPGCKHAFLSREEASRNGKIGVEYASPEAIRRALAAVHTEIPEQPEAITWEELMAAGLCNGPGARRRREALGRRLGIGYANARQFHKRLRVFGVSREMFYRALREVEEGLAALGTGERTKGEGDAGP
ncbi:MAG TPA: ribonuclease M5 [Calditerricola sp.]